MQKTKLVLANGPLAFGSSRPEPWPDPFHHCRALLTAEVFLQAKLTLPSNCSLAGLKLSGLSCSTVVSGRPQGHEVLGMEMLISGGRLSLPWSPPSRGTGHWGKSNRNNTLLSLHMQLGLLPHGKRGE